MEKINNLEDVDENSDIIDMWTPLDFDSNENYKFVSDNDLYNLISDVVYYFVAVPVIYIISKVMFGLKIEGRENLEKVRGSAITVSNHVHFLDCAMIGLAMFPKRIYYTASDGSFKMPIVRHLVKLLNALPISDNLNSKKRLLLAIDDLLSKGEKVHFYPEASMWPYHKKIRKFKNGAFEVAVRNNVPIIPIVFKFREVTGLRKFIKEKPFITLKILEPVYPNTEVPRREQIENLKEAISKAMKEESRNLYEEI